MFSLTFFSAVLMIAVSGRRPPVLRKIENEASRFNLPNQDTCPQQNIFSSSVTPVRSAMSPISTFHPHKLSIVLMRYYVDGGRTGRGECN